MDDPRISIAFNMDGHWAHTNVKNMHKVAPLGPEEAAAVRADVKRAAQLPREQFAKYVTDKSLHQHQKKKKKKKKKRKR